MKNFHDRISGPARDPNPVSFRSRKIMNPDPADIRPDSEPCTQQCTLSASSSRHNQSKCSDRGVGSENSLSLNSLSQRDSGVFFNRTRFSKFSNPPLSSHFVNVYLRCCLRPLPKPLVLRMNKLKKAGGLFGDRNFK